MLSRKKGVIFYARVIISLLIVVYLAKLIDWDRLNTVIPTLRYYYGWQAFVLIIISLLMMSLRWSFLLRKLGIYQTVINSWRYYMISVFYSMVLPGVIGGDVVRVALSIKEHVTKKTIIALSAVVERVCGLTIILLLALLASSFITGISYASTNVHYIILCIVSFVFCSAALFYFFIKFPPRKILICSDNDGFIIRKVSDIIKIMRQISIAQICVILCFSFLAHFADICGSYYLAKSISINQPFLFFLLVMPLVYIMTILPISLGGLGVREGVLTFFLVKVGVLASDAVLLSFLIYMTRMFVALLGGLIEVSSKLSSRR